MEERVAVESGAAVTLDVESRRQIGLPLLAVGLDLVAVVLFFGSSLFPMPSFLLLLASLAPIAGIILGIVCLRRGRKRMGTLGFILAIGAIALPLSVVALIVVFSIGVATGVISLM